MLRVLRYLLCVLCIVLCASGTVFAQDYKVTKDVASMSVRFPKDTLSTTMSEGLTHLYVKTNAVAWALLITNVEVETDLEPHLTVDLGMHCSAWNYFSSRCKYRVLSFYPSLRYWFDASNNGAFVGAHVGVASFNMAMNGDYRIQDHNGNSPAIGVGLSAGYRLPISRNGRWMAEACIGAGVYGLHYDKFHNEHNGLRTSTVEKTGICLDHASLSLCYMFDLKKRK